MTYKKITPITEEALEKMPRKMSKRLRPALHHDLEEEFLRDAAGNLDTRGLSAEGNTLRDAANILAEEF